MRNPSGFEFYHGRRLPVVCRDGVIRSAVITGQADTWFSIPAAVQVTAAGKRRTVAGFLSHDMAGKVCFRAYLYRANHSLIPWTSHKPRLAKLARKLIAATAYSKTAEGLPSDHAAALADVCRTEAAGLTEPSGQESPGWIARRLLRRLWEEDVNRLARFFDTLGRLQSSAGE
jgi:hypothetical protein